MNDFSILHLSDLHINGTGTGLAPMLKNLLKDIENEMQVVDNVILVITGDIVHRARYDQYEENALSFFKQLKETLKEKVKDVYIVPGNHDLKHKPYGCRTAKIYTEEKSQEFKELYWQYILVGYKEYLELVKKIYRIFEVEYEPQNTYGVRCTSINQKRICFLSMDTSWSSKGGEQDVRNLKFGKFQAGDIFAQYTEIIEKEEVDLVIAIAHHPLDWLTGKEQSLIQDELLSTNRLGANIYISGHVHNRDVINWQNNRHSMTTLVSGIGWPDGSELHNMPHVYSCYTFNLDLNSIDVYVRSSNEANDFKPDFGIYTQEQQIKNRKIVMPIRITETQTYFELGVVKGRSAKGCYITPDMIKEISSMMQLVLNYQRNMIWKLKSIEYDYIMQVRNNLKEQEFVELLEKFFNNTRLGEIQFPGSEDFILKMFAVYLQEMCDILFKLLQSKIENRKIRVHFRYWSKKMKEYAPLTVACEDVRIDKMKSMKWSELLEKSYEADHCLIASVNEKYCKESFRQNMQKEDPNQKWSDFLTSIPRVGNNIYIQREALTEKVVGAFSYITFGITIYDEKDRRLLYVLDYLRIDKIVDKIIQDFLDYFPIDFKKFAETRENSYKKSRLN